MDTELERLMVRLVGEDVGFQTMIDKSMKSMLDWAKAAGAAEAANKQVNEVNRKSVEGFGHLNSAINQVMGGIGQFNTQAGVAVNLLGMVGRAGGLAGAAIAGVGVAAAAAMAVINYQMDRAIDIQAATEHRRQITLTEAHQREVSQAHRYPLLSPIAGVGMLPIAEQRMQMEHRMSSVQSEIRLLQADAASKAIAARGSAQTASQGLGSWTGVLPWNIGEYRRAMEETKQAIEATEKWRTTANQHVETLKAMNRELEEGRNMLEKGRWQNISQGMFGLAEQTMQFTMGEHAFAKFQFLKQNEITDLPEPLKRVAIQQFEKRYEEMFKARTQWQAQGMGFQLETMKGQRQEVIDPLSVELRIQNEVNQAKREYFQQHTENMPQILASSHELIATQRQNNRLTQEGFQTYLQFLLPVERLIMDQTKLRQQFSAMEGAGMRNDERMQWARLRSMEAAYGVAHRDFSQYRLGQQYEAIQSYTSQYTRGLWEYTMGSTPIPLDMIKNRGKGDKRGLSDAELYGYGPEVVNVDDPVVMNLQTIKEGIKQLVEQGKKRENGGGAELVPANL